MIKGATPDVFGGRLLARMLSRPSDNEGVRALGDCKIVTPMLRELPVISAVFAFSLLTLDLLLANCL